MCTTARSPLPTSIACSDADIAGPLADAVRRAGERRERLRIVGGDTKAFYGHASADEALIVAAHRGVIAYEPTELVITARAGTPVIEIEALLAKQGQMLAFEPPVFGPASTIGGVVAAGLAGPRRPFAGAVRDFVLGVTVLDGLGRTLRLGGTVVKNVAGFDGFRLMAGSLGCLGVLLDVSLRVAPMPRTECALRLDVDLPEARRRLSGLLRRPLPLSGAFHDGPALHMRLSGAQSAVAQAAREIGGEDASLDIWQDLRDFRLDPLTAPRLWRVAVPRTAGDLPLEGRCLHDWAGAQRWLVSNESVERVRAAAAAGGGHAVLFRGAAPGETVFSPLPGALLALHQRLKRAFDPLGVFNPGRMYQDL